MKTIKKSLSVILAILMMFTVSAVAFAAEGDVTVKLRIEGIKENWYYEDVTVSADATVADVLEKADAGSESLSIEIKQGEYGPYVTEINGLVAGTQTEKRWDGWNYIVNDVAPEVGIADTKVNNNDVIVVYYADGANPVQFPEINLDKINQGKISFTSKDTVYDEEWNSTVVENPVKDYTVTWNDHGHTVILYPDENGVCTIPANNNTKGEHSLQIEKYDERTGMPLVLRFEPDFTVNVKNPENFVAKLASFFYMILDIVMNVMNSIKNLISRVG